LLDQAVVAAAAADPALRAQHVAAELEHRARVVVEAAHQQRVQRVGDSEVVQQSTHGGKVFSTGIAEVVRDLGRVCLEGLARLVLAIEQA